MTGFGDQAVAEVEAEMTALCEGLAACGAPVDTAMAGFVTDFFALVRRKGSRPGMVGMITLPMLVRGAETGDPWPAKPAAMIHLLWWAAARYLDDLVDADDVDADRVEVNKRVLTAIAVGSHLPNRVISTLPVTAEIRGNLAEEVSRGWLDAIDGQLMDLTATPESATPESVLRSYGKKTGAPYAMASALGACLAGVDEPRRDRWREYGRMLGILRQLVNDQRDLVTGRHEDLRNGTATYLLVRLLRSLPAERREAALALRRAAPTSPEAREELAAWMLDDAVLWSYAQSVAPIVERARALVDLLGGDPGYTAGLHDLVDEAVSFFPAFRLAAATGRGHRDERSWAG